MLFEHVWNRPELSPRDRSLITVAVLAAGGDYDQLAWLVQGVGAMNVARGVFTE